MVKKANKKPLHYLIVCSILLICYYFFSIEQLTDSNDYNFHYNSNHNKIAIITSNYGDREAKVRDIDVDSNIFDCFIFTNRKFNSKKCLVVNDTNYLTYHEHHVDYFFGDNNQLLYNNSIDKYQYISKYYKIMFMFHPLLVKYKRFFWIDNAFEVNNKHNLHQLIDDNYDFQCLKHPMNVNILQEYNQATNQIRYLKQKIMKQLDAYRSLNKTYITKLPICTTGFFITKRNKQTEAFFLDWWYEIKTYSTECQMSFPVSAIRHNINVKYYIPNATCTSINNHQQRISCLFCSLLADPSSHSNCWRN